ncbi:MAG: aminotransferase class V-fold PLP-dependent enzyme [Anaerolineae bacterium]
MSYYQKLGISPIINAMGTMTMLGGSRIHPKAVEAMVAVSQEFVDLNALLIAAGVRIAELTRAPAAHICTGAAAGIALTVAACMTGTDEAKIQQLPQTYSMRYEVILDGAQCNPFQHSIPITGASIVEVGGGDSPMNRRGLEAALSERTAAVFYFVAWAHPDGLPLDLVIEIAHAAGVPVIVDAAAQLPPADNLWNYTEMGADLVIFSGGKDIRGPQTAGFILGRSDLIEACRLNGNPHEATIGRAMKTSKEDIVGLVVALEQYLQKDFESEMENYEKLVEQMRTMFAGIPHLNAYRVCPAPPDIQPNTIPRLYVDPDPKLAVDILKLKDHLLKGDPGIAVAMSPTGLIVNPQTLTMDEAVIVVRRIGEEIAALQRD